MDSNTLEWCIVHNNPPKPQRCLDNLRQLLLPSFADYNLIKNKSIADYANATEQ